MFAERGAAMRKVILVAVALVIFLLGTVPQTVTGIPAKRAIAGAVAQTNNSGAARTDFHIRVSSDTNMNCIGMGANGQPLGGQLSVAGGAFTAATVQNNNTTVVTMVWDNLTIAVGALVKGGFSCEQEEENDFTVSAFFTGSSIDSPTLGWRVTAHGPVFLANGYPAAVSFQDMRLQFPIEMTTASMLALLEGPPSGVTASVLSGTVPATGELLVDLLSLNVGDFLTARLDTGFVDPGFSELQATIVIGHEHQAKSVGGLVELPEAAEARSATPAWSPKTNGAAGYGSAAQKTCATSVICRAASRPRPRG